jgi:hypothetical protein
MKKIIIILFLCFSVFSLSKSIAFSLGSDCNGFLINIYGISFTSVTEVYFVGHNATAVHPDPGTGVIAQVGYGDSGDVTVEDTIR